MRWKAADGFERFRWLTGRGHIYPVKYWAGLAAQHRFRHNIEDGYVSSFQSEIRPPIRIGPAGWSYPDWKGIVYPDGMGGHPLEWLRLAFDTVELNVTFYRPPQARDCTKWLALVEDSPSFRFTAKLWNRFTHKRDSLPNEGEATSVREGLAPLQEAGRLGALLLQFPWSFHRTVENRKWLASIVALFEDFPLVVELRHRSWDRPEVYAAFASRDIAFCNIDQPIVRDAIGPSGHVTASRGYIRLHGRNSHDWFRDSAKRDDRYKYLYTADELKEWLTKIEHMQIQVKDLYIITNNHYRGQAVVNALELRHALGLPVRHVPQTLLDQYPRLRSIVSP